MADRLVHPLILQGFLPFLVCLVHRTPFITPQVHPPPWKEDAQDELLDSNTCPEEAAALVAGVAAAAAAAASSSDEIPVEEVDTDLATTEGRSLFRR